MIRDIHSRGSLGFAAASISSALACCELMVSRMVPNFALCGCVSRKEQRMQCGSSLDQSERLQPTGRYCRIPRSCPRTRLSCLRWWARQHDSGSADERTRIPVPSPIRPRQMPQPKQFLNRSLATNCLKITEEDGYTIVAVCEDASNGPTTS